MSKQDEMQYKCCICKGEGYLPVDNNKADELNLTMYAQIFYKSGDRSKPFVKCNRCCGSGVTRSPH